MRIARNWYNQTNAAATEAADQEEFKGQCQQSI